MPPAANGVTATMPYLSNGYGPQRAANTGIIAGTLAKSNFALVESSGNTFSRIGSDPEVWVHCQYLPTVTATR